MDGNGRWARRRGLPTVLGHRAGTRALRRTVEAAIDLGIRHMVVYAFSTENWSRPQDEVDALMELFGETIERELPDLAEQGVRVRFIGRRDRAPESLRRRMEAMEDRTELNMRLGLWIAFDYGGRAELVEATRRIAESGLDPREIDENVLAAHLYAPDLPGSRPADPDERRAPRLELHALAARLRRARVRRPALARLRRARPARRARRVRQSATPVRRTMTNIVSRLLVAVAAIPIVLGAIYLGGWWLFALVAVGAVLGLHEFWLLSKRLSPLSPAGYVGGILALRRRRARRGRLDDRRGARHARARVPAEGDVRDARGADGVDLGHAVRARSGSAAACRSCCSCGTSRLTGGSRRSPSCSRSGPGDTLAYAGRAAARPAPDGSEHLAREDVGGIRLRDRGDGVRRVRGALQGELPLDHATRSSSASCSRSPRRWATSSSRC